MGEIVDAMQSLVTQFGGPGLLVVALIGATILPLSSEVALAAAIGLGMNMWEAFLWASIGNCLGATSNYWVGYLFSKKICRWLSSKKEGEKAIARVERHGAWGLLLSWIPFIGDPLTYAAGAFRIHFAKFVAIALPVRVVRYLIVILFFL
jgi:membrane protein YqaA with SNARE-associated domain